MAAQVALYRGQVTRRGAQQVGPRLAVAGQPPPGEVRGAAVGQVHANAGRLGEHVREPRPPQRGAPGGGAGARWPAEDAPGHAAQRGRAVLVARVAVREHRHREADAAPLEERRLVHQAPGRGAAPAALEERPEAGPLRVAREAPALRGHDRREQVSGVGAVAARHEPVDPQEEARLVDRRDARGRPVPRGPRSGACARARPPAAARRRRRARRRNRPGRCRSSGSSGRAEPARSPWARAGRSRGGRPRASSPWSRSPTRRPPRSPAVDPAARVHERERLAARPLREEAAGGGARACAAGNGSRHGGRRGRRGCGRGVSGCPASPVAPGRRTTAASARDDPAQVRTPPGASRHGGRRARRLRGRRPRRRRCTRACGAAGEHARVDGEEAVRVAGGGPDALVLEEDLVEDDGEVVAERRDAADREAGGGADLVRAPPGAPRPRRARPPASRRRCGGARRPRRRPGLRRPRTRSTSRSPTRGSPRPAPRRSRSRWTARAAGRAPRAQRAGAVGDLVPHASTLGARPRR